MEIFTYKDYLKYKDLLKESFEICKILEQEKDDKNVSMIMEEEIKYIPKLSNEKSNRKINNEHDKIFRTVLDKKTDVAKFISKFLNIKIEKDELEKYNSSYINPKFKNREADVVYKIKDKNVFLLIEHQTKIDYLMPLRILEYSIEIIRSSINGKKINKILELPLIIPVVIYTGNEKWDANEYIEKSQAKLDKYKIRIGQYNLIDINNYTKKELLEDETFITKMMAVEKCRNTKEIVDVLETITKIVKEEDKETLERIIKEIWSNKIGTRKSNEILNKLEEGSVNMLGVVERLKEEWQMCYDNGKEEGKIEGKIEGKMQQLKEIVQKMLSKKMPEDIIEEITGLKKEEIDKLKNSKQ